LSIKETILNTLALIEPSCRQLEDDHYLIGASAMILSGIPIAHTSDIDLVTSSGDAMRLHDLWQEKCVSSYTPAHADKFRSAFARYRFPTMDVEVMGNLEVHHNGKWDILEIGEWISLQGTTLKIPTLEEQKRILTIFGRPKDLLRLQLIERHLQDQSEHGYPDQ
jgi:hypothetical protein